MARNIEDSRNYTTRAMKLTLVGISFLILSFISVGLSANNFHILGSWQKNEMKKAHEITNMKDSLKTEVKKQHAQSDTLLKNNK